MKNFATIILCWILSSTSSYAKEIDKARLERDQKAPFEGILLTDGAMAKIITDYEAKIKDLQLELEKSKRELAAQATFSEEVSKVKQEACEARKKAVEDDRERQRQLYENALTKCNADQLWYKTSSFGFVMGQIVMGGACIGLGQFK